MTVSPDEARAVALSLPEAVEQDHHGRPSFRAGGKIFATLWSAERMNVMLDEGGILTANRQRSPRMRAGLVGQEAGRSWRHWSAYYGGDDLIEPARGRVLLPGVRGAGVRAS